MLVAESTLGPCHYRRFISHFLGWFREGLPNDRRQQRESVRVQDHPEESDAEDPHAEGAYEAV